MLFATMLLMSQLTLSQGLLQDQDRTIQMAQAQTDKTRAARPAVRSGRGQRAPSQPTLDEVRVFRLKHAQCQEVVFTLKHMLGDDRVITDERTNSIIFAGSKEQAAKIEELLAILDTPADGPVAESELSIVAVRHRDVRSLANEIHAAMDRGLGAGRYLNIAADQARSKILLDGERRAVLKAKSIIKELDTPAAMANLEFAFLKATSGDTQPGSAIPDDLKDVANELKRFGRIELLGRLVTMAVEGEPFKVSGEKNGMSYSIRGKLVHASEDGSVKSEVEAQLNQYLGRDRGKTGRRAYNTVFKLETLVLTQRGDYVVLGSAPGSGTSKPGESVILVLHVPR